MTWRAFHFACARLTWSPSADLVSRAVARAGDEAVAAWLELQPDRVDLAAAAKSARVWLEQARQLESVEPDEAMRLAKEAARLKGAEEGRAAVPREVGGAGGVEEGEGADLFRAREGRVG